MISYKKYPISNTDICVLLGIKEVILHKILKKIPVLYKEIQIEKKTGGHRVLNAPVFSLKKMQRIILDEILNPIPLDKCVYGFGKKKGIIENARLHAKNPYLLSIDIKNFFPSVRYTRVRKIFIDIGIPISSATILTRITTLYHCLPQGAPTSPYLATLALKNLDQRLLALCKSNRLTYSRYFDDITISGSKRAHEIFKKVAYIIEKEGYGIHRAPEKLRFNGPNEEKIVTGIHIKDGELLPQIKEVLEYVSALQKRGLSALKSDNPLKEQMSLKGKISFIQQVDPKVGMRLMEEFNKIKW